MDVADLERVYEAFQDFHVYFAPAFGRKQWRDIAAPICKACWCSPRSGATPRTLGNGFAVDDAAFSHRGAGTMIV